MRSHLFIAAAFITGIASAQSPKESDIIKKEVFHAWSVVRTNGISGLKDESIEFYLQLKPDSLNDSILQGIARDMFGVLLDQEMVKKMGYPPNSYFNIDAFQQRIGALMKGKGYDLDTTNKMIGFCETEVPRFMKDLPASTASLASAQNFSSGLESAKSADAEAKVVAELKAEAARGSEIAQFDLGKRFIDGRGVESDNYQALKWLLKASAQGNLDASQQVLEIYRWLQGKAGQGDAKALDALATIPGHSPKRSLVQDFRFHKSVIGYFPHEFSDQPSNFIVVQVLKVFTVKVLDRVGNKADRTMIYGLSNVAAGGSMVFKPPKWITNWVEMICVNKSTNGRLSLQTDQFLVGKSYLFELSNNGSDPTYYPTPSPNVATTLQAWATAEGNQSVRRPLSRAPIQMIRLPNGKVEN